jgi:hypothetical protein
MISYQDYLNLLKDKNVLLYDFQKRISYSRLQHLVDNPINLEQNGGGLYNNIKINDFSKLVSLEKHNLEKVITLLNYKNFGMARILLDKLT